MRLERTAISVLEVPVNNTSLPDVNDALTAEFTGFTLRTSEDDALAAVFDRPV